MLSLNLFYSCKPFNLLKFQFFIKLHSISVLLVSMFRTQRECAWRGRAWRGVHSVGVYGVGVHGMGVHGVVCMAGVCMAWVCMTWVCMAWVCMAWCTWRWQAPVFGGRAACTA
jgi:hypothetical protein